MAKTYDLQTIDALIKRTAEELGDSFGAMRLIEAEREVRRRDAAGALPGKTLLRERINAYRSSRWAHSAPKRLTRRF